MKWLAVSLVWSWLLLGGLFCLVFGPTMPNVVAALSNTSAITFSAISYTINEGDENGTVVLLITPTSSTPVTVTLSSANMQAEAPNDFVAVRQSMVISPSVPALTLTVTLIDDTLVEGNEELGLTLSNYQGVEAGAITETIVLIEDNDDDALPQLELAAAEASEREGVLSFVVTLTSTWGQTVTVEYATMDDSAVAPNDYFTSTGVLMLAPGQLTSTLPVTLVIDQVEEPDEGLWLVLSNPVQATLAVTQVEGIIYDSSQGYLFLPRLKR